MDSDVYSLFQRSKNPTDFEAIGIKLASPEKIREWSYGAVRGPETINYRTFKPERDGLFCAKIFGPVKDWECLCGKYKRIKHRGVVCDKCGVEVIQSKVRRERMGHVELATPVAHIWFLRSRPSIIGTLLGIGIRNLEKVLYFESYIVIDPGDTPLKEKELLIDEEYKKKTAEHGSRFKAGMGAEAIREFLRSLDLETLAAKLRLDIRQTRSAATKAKIARRLRLVEAFRKSGNRPEWMITDAIPVLPPDLRPLVPLEGGHFATSDLNDLYRRVINRNNRLKRLMELKAPSVVIKNEKKMLQESVDALFDNGRRSRVLKTATMRPLKSLSDMIRGKEGRFRQNLLGKRVDYSGISVIVPDPTLRLHQCGLPKKMALELFKPFVFNKLIEKGFATTLKAAKGLVEKVAEYSSKANIYEFITNIALNKEEMFNRLTELKNLGLICIRSTNLDDTILETWDSLVEQRTISDQIINVPPTFHQVFAELLKKGYVTVGENVVKRRCNQCNEVWDALQEVLAEHPVLLNRAPTLHRLGIQAFYPVLVEGKALRLHPLVCKSFNADFDGDQMAVHVPLSLEAQIESRLLMSPTHNILSPADGEPIITPTQDIILGIYYLTKDNPENQWNGMFFSDTDEVRSAYDSGVISEHTKIKVRTNGERVVTTLDRVLLKEILPCEFPFSRVNKTIRKDDVQEIIKGIYSEFGRQATINFLNDLVRLGFEYATKSGISICMDDIVVPIWKQSIVEDAQKKECECRNIVVNGEDDDSEQGAAFTEQENEDMILETWKKAAELINTEVTKEFKKADRSLNSIYMTIDSGARGSFDLLKYLCGMRGLMLNSSGEMISTPVISNFREGLSPREFFMTSYGARKGLTVTSLRIANAGYLMRRLVDVAHDVVVIEDDCGTRDGILMSELILDGISILSLEDRIMGRFSAEEIRHEETGEVLVQPNQAIDEVIAKRIVEGGTQSVRVHSPLTCHSYHGVCSNCYGRNLSSKEVVEVGEAVGIIAAQSIGEPGTQLALDGRHLDKDTQDYFNAFSGIAELFEGRKSKTEKITDAREILKKSGLRDAQVALLNCLQNTYRANGINIHDKHFEVVIRKMTEKVKIEDPGDTLFLRGELVQRKRFIEENTRVQFEGGRPATGSSAILGITKASLSNDSWISAASFQETTKVLTEAAINGAIDELKGLKENMIIGRLVPCGTGTRKYRDTFVKRDAPTEVVE